MTIYKICFASLQCLRFVSIVIGTMLVAASFAQRSPYAGSRPQGYKDRFRPSTAAVVDNDIGSRFGNGNTATANLISPAPTPSRQRIPIELQHDREAFNIYNRFPEYKRPFWILNYRTLEAHRQPIRGRIN